jgi:hypothetical protein
LGGLILLLDIGEQFGINQTRRIARTPPEVSKITEWRSVISSGFTGFCTSRGRKCSR